MPNGDYYASSCGTAGPICTPSSTTWGPTNGIGVNWAAAANGGVAKAGGPTYGYYYGTDGACRYHSNQYHNISAINDGDRVNASNYFYSSNSYVPNTTMGEYNCAYTAKFGANSSCSGGVVIYPYTGVAFSGTGHNINELDIFQLQDGNRTTPTPGMTFSSYGANTYHIKYCPTSSGGCRWPSSSYPSGTNWVDLDYAYASSDAGWNHVWNHVSFASVSATAVMFTYECNDSGLAYMAEIEAWDTTSVGTNWAASANGGVASASSTYDSYLAPAGAIDGDRSAFAWNTSPGPHGSGWNSSTPTFPQVLDVSFSGTKTISEVDVFTLQDNYTSPAVPTLGQTFSYYGVSNFNVQYCPAGATCTCPNGVDANGNTCMPGTGWKDVQGSPVNSQLVWQQLDFPPVSTPQIRIVVNASADGWTRIAEVEAWDFSNGSGTYSSDYATAMSLRRDMGGESGCGAIASTVINGVTGYQAKCSYDFDVWSPNNGAWFLPVPSYFAASYLGGTTWPSQPTNQMSQLGFPANAFYGQDTVNEYQSFQNGVLATAAGRSDPHVIGGIPQCSNCSMIPPGAGCSCNAADHNNALTSFWLNGGFTTTSYYPIDDTREYSLSYTAPPGSQCGPSSFGQRAWLFDSVPVAGYTSTFVVKDTLGAQAHTIAGADQATWLNAGCDTQGALGWPVSQEAAYPSASGCAGTTKQEFDHGTITWAPSLCSNCGSTWGSTIRTNANQPNHQFLQTDLACPATTNAQPPCVNDQYHQFGNNPYRNVWYWHCPGIETEPPGTVGGQGGFFSGITVLMGGSAGACVYSVDEPTLTAWMTVGSTSSPPTVDQAIVSTTPGVAPPQTALGFGCTPWSWDDRAAIAASPQTVQFSFGYGCLSGGFCSDDAPTTYYEFYVSADGTFTSQPTQIAQDGAGVQPPGGAAGTMIGTKSLPLNYAPNLKNCIFATYGSPQQTSPTQCWYTSNDAYQRPVSRLTMTIVVDPSSPILNPLTGPGKSPWSAVNPPGSEQFYVQLQDQLYGTIPTGNYSWPQQMAVLNQGAIATPPNTYTFDLSLSNISDLDNITRITLGNTNPQSICLDSIVLKVDDDGDQAGQDLTGQDMGALNAGDSGPLGTPLAYRIAYQQQWPQPGKCFANSNFAAVNDSNALNITFGQLRSSADWQYQHTWWSSVRSAYPSVQQSVHFGGLYDTNALVDYFYGQIQNQLHDRGGSLYMQSVTGSCSGHGTGCVSTWDRVSLAGTMYDAAGGIEELHSGPANVNVDLVSVCDANNNPVQWFSYPNGLSIANTDTSTIVLPRGKLPILPAVPNISIRFAFNNLAAPAGQMPGLGAAIGNAYCPCHTTDANCPSW